MQKNVKSILRANIFSIALILIPMLVHASHDLYKELNDALHTLNPSKVEQVLKNLKKPLDYIDQEKLDETLYELGIRFDENFDDEDFDNAYACIELLLKAGADTDSDRRRGVIAHVVRREIQLCSSFSRQPSEREIEYICNVIKLLAKHSSRSRPWRLNILLTYNGIVFERGISPLYMAACELQDPKLVKCLLDAGIEHLIKCLLNAEIDRDELNSKYSSVDVKRAYNAIKQELKTELGIDISDVLNQHGSNLKRSFEIIYICLQNARTRGYLK